MSDEDERRRLIAYFIDVFLVDDAVARDYLDRNDWNVETAVRDYLTAQEAALGATFDRSGRQRADAAQATRDAVVSNNTGSLNVVYPHSIFRLLLNLLYIPYYYVVTIASDVASALCSILVMPFQRRSDGRADVRSFAEKFENAYGVQHPTFYRGTYSSALADAKRDLRYVVVYLHSFYHEHSDRFCRDVICHPDFVNFVEGVGLFFAVDVGSGEGYRVSTIMMDTSYPFLAMVCYRSRRMSVVFRQEGYADVHELIPRMSRVVNVNDHYLSLAREERQNTEMNQMLRQQQEAAYEEALQRDREIEQRFLDEVKKKQQEEAMKKAAKDKEEEEKRNLMDMRQRCAASLPVEPVGKDAIRIRLKFSSGDTFERHFLSSDLVTTLRDFVFSKPCCPKNFSVFVGYPRRLMYNSQRTDDQDGAATIGQFCTGKAEVVLIVDNDA